MGRVMSVTVWAPVGEAAVLEALPMFVLVSKASTLQIMQLLCFVSGSYATCF